MSALRERKCIVQLGTVLCLVFLISIFPVTGAPHGSGEQIVTNYTVLERIAGEVPPRGYEQPHSRAGAPPFPDLSALTHLVELARGSLPPDLQRQLQQALRELLIALLQRRASIEVLWDEHRYLNDYYADMRAYKVAVDDVVLALPAAPRLLSGGNLIVPAVAVLAAMGAEVTWTPESGVLEATRDDVRVRLVTGVNVFAAGEQELEMSEPPRVEGGVLMIAPRGPIEALGGALQWNRADNTLYVRSRAEAEERE